MTLFTMKGSEQSSRRHKRISLDSRELRYPQSKSRRVRDLKGCGEDGEWACGASSDCGEQRVWDLLVQEVENSSVDR